MVRVPTLDSSRNTSIATTQVNHEADTRSFLEYGTQVDTEKKKIALLHQESYKARQGPHLVCATLCPGCNIEDVIC
ncbi:hypothetical protein PCANC_00700 [Puccinia coronata f. sp. avenae]|uniref:Uncharacterized protein n=1 Tax=Puccinia coronata f. sp. avenae TaxID=200324 RepID=A0A2N5VNC7_9BASI|nr:hypothetical protein PCANC_25554 [Puccinia coronata f. sp. avenae]PLW51491.1 hypothetical protein PCASD_00408 [Puccinia coronata f. sp. avenae]PLW57938.1 hypothetical protein PCANC_00700 [Puccinia coronata f. sp. avenae]